MKRNYVLVCILSLIISCKHQIPPEEEIINEILRETVDINTFHIIKQGNNETLSFAEFREMFNYISLVYLDEACAVCYPRFIDWQTKIKPLIKRSDFTVLFIIRGLSYEIFIENALKYGDFQDSFYYVKDPYNTFLTNNQEIPSWIFFDLSVLIDSENKIKLIGPPFVTPEMAESFLRFIGETNLYVGETSSGHNIWFEKEIDKF